MFRAIFIQGIWERRKSLFVWSIAMFGISLFFTYLFESIGRDFGDVLKDIPPAFEAIVGEIGQLATPEGWLGIELYGLFLPIALSIITIGYGAGTIGKEEESGTLELLLASPVTRNQIALAKGFSLAVVSAIIALAVWLGVVLGTLIFPFEISWIDTFWATVSGWLLSLLLGYFAFSTQSLTKSRTIALSAGTGLLIVAYFINTLSTVVSSIEFVKYASPFYYFNGQGILTSGVYLPHIAVLLLASLAVYLIGIISFAKRDVN